MHDSALDPPGQRARRSRMAPPRALAIGAVSSRDTVSSALQGGSMFGFGRPTRESDTKKASYASGAGKDLSVLDLSGLTFGYCNFQGANFTGANLSGTTFRYCPMEKSILVSANLTGATLEYCEMKGAQTQG